VILASIPSPPAEWQTFRIGEWLRSIGASWATFDISIHAYALCILTGIVVGLIITNRRLVARGVEPWLVLDIALFAVPMGIIGGRAYHVITHPADYFAGQDIMRVFYVWEGGLAIFGALILGAVGGWIGCRVSGLRFTALLDAIAPGLIVAQAIGRFGNYFNRELFGTPTDLPWGLEIESTNPAFPIGLPAGTLFHPTFLYEALWNVLGAFVIIWAGRRFTLQWGRTFAVYLMWYGLGRVAIESIRLDPSESFLGIRVNVWAAIGAIVLGLVILLVQRRRHPGLEPDAYVPNRGPRAEYGLESGNTYTLEELAGEADSSGSRSGATSASRR
jgi:prolipoprotein diacylglyceryl transferase